MSLERIRKLVNLALDQEGTPEGDTAMRLARDLMVERNVELSQLGLDERERVDPFRRSRVELGGKAHWRCKLMSLVAQHCECVAGWSTAGTGSFYGRKSAVEVAEYLFVVLLRQLCLERAAFIAGVARPEAQDAGGRIRDFCQTALLALSLRLEQLRSAEAPECTALVRQSSRGLGDWMDGSGHALAKEPPFGFSYDEDGYRAGYRLPLVGAVESH
ncbi:MAG TPA: DUF2786 domain-containing protein [Myxococcota bacterium]|nr:DUF2786 domain-containing protein [Myxococcota bacterium]